MNSDKRPKVGIIWKPDQSQQDLTHILEQFLPLFKQGNKIALYSLQIPISPEEALLLEKNNFNNLEHEMVGYAYVGALLE